MVYLSLFHGRLNPDEHMDDWGMQGPTLGPFKYIHMTYGGMDLKFETEGVPGEPRLIDMFQDHDGMLYYDGVYYGDCSVISQKTLEESGMTAEQVVPRKLVRKSAKDENGVSAEMLEHSLGIVAEGLTTGECDLKHLMYCVLRDAVKEATKKDDDERAQ